MSDRNDSSRPETAAGTDVVERVLDDPSQFVSVTAQFYRAEMDRVATWRTRLDQTTNWAVVVIAAIFTLAFTSPDNPHYVLLIGGLATSAFLFIEAQRYQEYDAWRARVLLVQRNFLADVYRTRGPEDPAWRDHLSRDLREPAVRLPLWKAVAHRLHRVYFPLFTVVLAAWAVRISVFESGAPWYRTASIATVSGPAVVAGVAVVYLAAAGLTVWSTAHAAKREFDEDPLEDDPRDGT